MAFSPPAPRGWAAIAVIAAWAASLTWLGLRQFGHPDSDSLSSEASLRLAPGDAWLSVMVGATQVGTVGITLDTLSPGFRILESSTLELPQDTGLVHSARFTRLIMGPTLAIQEIATSWSRPGRRTGIGISATPDDWTARFEGDDAATEFMSAESHPTTLQVLPYQMALARGLVTKRELKVMMLDGWPPMGRETTVRVERDTTVTYPDSMVFDASSGKWNAITSQKLPGKVLTIDGASGPMAVTTDMRGRIQGMETLVGVRWVRTNFELAMNAFRHTLAIEKKEIRNAYPIVAALASRKKQPADSSVERRFIVAHRDGSPLTKGLLQLIGGGRQRISGDTLIILPSGAQQAPTSTTIVARDETVDPLLSISSARMIAPGGHQTIEDLLQFVQSRIALDTTQNAPEGAARALQSGYGRPDAVARAFVALAQSAHLSARYVIGIMPAGDSMLTHAWAEVQNSRGAWLAVDPVFGKTEASTSLIRLAWGGSSYPEDMLALIANAKFTPVATGTRP